MASTFQRNYLLAAAPSTTRGSPVHLGGDPKGERFLYTNGKTVYIRNLKNPEVCTEYTEHSVHASVARFSPSGYYVASGDVNGHVRVWDAVQDTHILKFETKVISGKINDIDWDSESKRIIAVGDGKDKFGHVFMFDSGSSVGEISGHSKTINSCSFRQQRPFRAVTCADDFTVNFYHGAPYKFNLSISDHTRFVHCVKFSPNGSHFVSVGADGKVFLYDGTTGAKVKELTHADTHKGGIFSFSWSPDSTQIFTASGDMTCKLWDIETSSVVNTFNVSNSPKVDDQQVGSLWQGDHLISLSLSGNINYWNPKTGSDPTRVVYGHSKAITAAASIQDKTFYTGSYDGRVYSWSGDYSSGGLLSGGAGHTNQVSELKFNGKDKIFSIGLDDSLKTIDVSNAKEGKYIEAEVSSTPGQPKGLAVFPNEPNASVVLTVEGVHLAKSAGKPLEKLNIKNTGYEATCVAINPAGTQLAVGGSDNKVHLFKLNGTSEPVEDGALEGNRGAITVISYSPDGSLIASCDSQSKIFVFEASTRQLKIHQWVFHSARVTCFSWSPDGKFAVSGSLDTNIIVWNVEKPMKKVTIKSAHQESVTNVFFLKDNNTIVSTGQDACIRVWNVAFN